MGSRTGPVCLEVCEEGPDAPDVTQRSAGEARSRRAIGGGHAQDAHRRRRLTNGVAQRALLLCAVGLTACSSSGGDDAVVGGAVSVTATSPGVVQGGDTAIPWTVTGTGFETGATVTVNTAGVTVAAVTVVSPTQITFDLTAPNTVVAGTTSVTVTNPDMTSGASVVPTIPETVLLSASVQPVLTASCGGCHSGVAPSGGLDLSAGTTHGTTVNVNSAQVPAIARVVPGDPDASYLVDKIEGTQTVGARMPLNAAPLTETETALVRAWIAAGALDN